MSVTFLIRHRFINLQNQTRRKVMLDYQKNNSSNCLINSTQTAMARLTSGYDIFLQCPSVLFTQKQTNEKITIRNKCQNCNLISVSYLGIMLCFILYIPMSWFVFVFRFSFFQLCDSFTLLRFSFVESRQKHIPRSRTRFVSFLVCSDEQWEDVV